MEYLLISIILYNLFLTLFVVRINNKMEGYQPTNTVDTSNPPNQHVIQPHPQTIIKSDLDNANLDELSKVLDEKLANTSHKDVETWLENKNEPIKVNNLNKGYRDDLTINY